MNNAMVAGPIINWIENNLPPFSWNFIKIGVCKTFVLNGINISKVDENTLLPIELVNALKECVKERFEVEIDLESL